MAEEEIFEIARGMLTGTHFSSDFIPPEQHKTMLRLVFFPLTFCEKEVLEELDGLQITMLVGKMSSAMSQSVNGYPILTEMKVVRRDDHLKIIAEYEKLEKVLYPTGRHKK